MKTLENSTEKRIYIKPSIESIRLDKEISLALQSVPPKGPGEGLEYNQNNPFKPATSLV